MLPADLDPVLHLALARGLVSAAALEAGYRALGDAAGTPGEEAALRRTLTAAGALDPAALARALAAECGLPFVELGAQPLPATALAAVPRSFALQHRVCPVDLAGGVLRVAVPDPYDLATLDALAHLTDRGAQPCVAAEPDLAQALARHYGDDANGIAVALPPPAAAAEPESPESAGTAAPGAAAGDDAPIIQLVHQLIHEAVRRRASDIHLEPLERRFRVRYRIDGVLAEVAAPPKRLQLAVISRLKIMANLSIAEKRVPQDGRIQVASHGRTLDLRVSSLPTAHGESIVMRLLDKTSLQLGLAELGFLPDDRADFERLIAAPDGIVLVTGPTGSGKTTTLYGCLHHLNDPGRKIITVEDPVEYQLSGINQVPVRAAVGMTFAAALRAMLRQAPNIVMVGEIRDRETAEIAINASLTGHLVLSTLHTNDAPGAVTRLCDIGVPPFLVAASLRATLAQRLVRRICPHCRQPATPDEADWRALGLTPAQAVAGAFARGAGCPECHGSGFLGRLGIFELFFINDEVRALIHARASGARLRACARRLGMRTMREDGARKVLAGLTTIGEVLAVTVGEPHPPPPLAP